MLKPNKCLLLRLFSIKDFGKIFTYRRLSRENISLIFCLGFASFGFLKKKPRTTNAGSEIVECCPNIYDRQYHTLDFVLSIIISFCQFFRKHKEEKFDMIYYFFHKMIMQIICIIKRHLTANIRPVLRCLYFVINNYSKKLGD